MIVTFTKKPGRLTSHSTLQGYLKEEAQAYTSAMNCFGLFKISGYSNLEQKWSMSLNKIII